jgi:hypothetical protein
MATEAGIAEKTDRDRKVVLAYPTKDFFVSMITKDISLRDCIFDLLDNSIDGARRTANDRSGDFPYAGFEVLIDFGPSHFQVADNSGGITLHDAINHAFHFGRRPDAPAEVAGGIGLYGIGMKRAIFKIGRRCRVSSQASDATFRVDIDVDKWIQDSKNWDFDYVDIPRMPGARGALIEIEGLNAGVSQMFGDETFKNLLIKDMARDYAFFIQKGLKVRVCGREVPSYHYRLSASEALQPQVEAYEDPDGVSVRILAGIADPIPDDVPQDLRPDKLERLGWFIICNDRVVLAADKTANTVWGHDNFQVWHGQYAGFAGFVFFTATDQGKLPWNTTKRGVDLESPLYRRTLSRMKAVTAEFIKYSHVRSAALEQAKKAESGATFVSIDKLQTTQALKLPKLPALETRPREVNILYQKPVAEVDEIRKELNRHRMSASAIGAYTFEYFRRVELGKK